MGESIFRSPRQFRIWQYGIGHSTLLLRSVKGPEAATRIDVLFKPVHFLSLPVKVDGVDIQALEPFVRCR